MSEDSGASRGRGRGRGGRGRGTVSGGTTPAPEASTSAAAASSSQPRFTIPSNAVPAPTGSLLRKNVYTSGTKLAFKPQLVKRKAESIPVVKMEDGDVKPFGKARGRGRGEIIMTASGPLALGPSARDTSTTSKLGRQVTEKQAAAAREARLAGTGSTAAYDDAEEIEKDLREISLENEMAPVVLPRDEEAYAREKELLLQDEKRKKPALQAKLRREAEKMSDLDRVKAKMDPEEELAMSEALLSSGTSTPIPMSRAQSSDKMDLDEEKEKKPLHSTSSKFEATTETDDAKLYVFQFPRLFPRFTDPGDPNASEAGPSMSKVKTEDGVDRWAESTYNYSPEIWTGWGRSAGLMGREQMGGKNLEGKIGELLLHESGKVRMVLGDIEYDVLPAARASFLQEFAVIDADPSKVEPQLCGGTDAAMYIMGQATEKFIVAPDLEKLLVQDRKERAEAAEVARIKAEEAADQARAVAAAKAAKAPTPAAAPKGVARKPVMQPAKGRGRGGPVASTSGTKPPAPK